jgi:hypothetical protein
VTVDDLGRTQAKPTRVWIMSRHSTIEQDLAEVLPGAQWSTWTSTQPERPLARKTQIAAEIISQHLGSVKQGRIAARDLKAVVRGTMGDISHTTFQNARDLAIKDTA